MIHLIPGSNSAELTQKVFVYMSNNGMSDLCNFDPDLLQIKRFKDGEIQPLISKSIRGDKVILIQSTHSSDSILELFFTVRACVRAGAESVSVIIPYFAYARQDRMGNERTTVTARDVMDMIELSGASSLMTIDLHAFQIQGFTNLPHDHLMGSVIFKDYFEKKYANSVVCSPDAGGVKRAENFCAKKRELVMMSKVRKEANKVAEMTFIGDSKLLQGRKIVIIDDIIDTGGTLVKAAKFLKSQGAESVSAFITHGVLSNPAMQRLQKSELDELVITDSIWHDRDTLDDKITVVSCDKVIAHSILRMTSGGSIKEMNNNI